MNNFILLLRIYHGATPHHYLTTSPPRQFYPLSFFHPDHLFPESIKISFNSLSDRSPIHFSPDSTVRFDRAFLLFSISSIFSSKVPLVINRFTITLRV